MDKEFVDFCFELGVTFIVLVIALLLWYFGIDLPDPFCYLVTP